MKGLVAVAIGLTAPVIGTRDGLAGQRQDSVDPTDLSRQSAAGAAADLFVTVNGLRIHYVDWGNAGAPPLILIHGLDLRDVTRQP
jgi:hypothetical protein